MRPGGMEAARSLSAEKHHLDYGTASAKDLVCLAASKAMTEEGENCGGSEALRRASINATAGDAASIFERPNGRCDTSVGTQVLPGDDGAAASGDAGQNRMGEGGDGTSPAIERGQRLVLEPSKQQRPEFPALGPCVSIDMECFRSPCACSYPWPSLCAQAQIA